MAGHKSRWMAFGWAAVLMGLRPAAASDGIEPIGISMQALSRGGADVAVGDSALSQIDNPATLTLSPDRACRLDLAGQLLMPRAHWSGRIDSADSTFRHIPLGHAGLAVPWNDRLTLGLAGYSKSHLASRYTIRHWVLRDRERRVGADMRDLALSFNLGYRSTEKLSIGAGVRSELGTAEFETVNGGAAVDFGRGCAIGGGFQLGLHYQALPTLALGLGYRSPTWFQDFTGDDARADWAGETQGSAFGFRPVLLGKGSIEDVQLPQRIAAGAAWDATDRLKLVGEARWIDYSASTLHAARFRFASPFLPMVLGLKSPLGYRDQWVFMTGAEVKLDQHWKLGLGYHYATNPISTSAVTPLTAGITQHHVTIGLRFETERWWVGGGYILGFRNALRADRRTRIPFGDDYRGTQIAQMEHSATLGFGFSW